MSKVKLTKTVVVTARTPLPRSKRSRVRFARGLLRTVATRAQGVIFNADRVQLCAPIDILRTCALLRQAR